VTRDDGGLHAVPAVLGAAVVTVGDGIGASGAVTAAAGMLRDGIGVVGRILAPTASTARAAVRSAWASARLGLLGLAVPTRFD